MKKYFSTVAFALAFSHAQSGLRHLEISSDDALLFERLASRVLHADNSLRADAAILASSTLGQPGLWAHAISGAQRRGYAGPGPHAGAGAPAAPAAAFAARH